MKTKNQFGRQEQLWKKRLPKSGKEMKAVRYPNMTTESVEWQKSLGQFNGKILTKKNFLSDKILISLSIWGTHLDCALLAKHTKIRKAELDTWQLCSCFYARCRRTNRWETGNQRTSPTTGQFRSSLKVSCQTN